MSEMTDALEDFIDAMEAEHGYRPQAWATGVLMNSRDADRFEGWQLAARLRGEAVQPVAVAGDAVRAEIETALQELDSITATDDQSDGIGCAENALRRALAALAQHRASQGLPSPVRGDQVADIVARWMDKDLSADVAMLVIKRHLDHCYMQPANDYNRGWVAGANSVTERAAELVADADRASQPALYSLDADPDGIRDRAAATITGALILGSRGDQAPPAGHWLEPFWTMAHAEAELRASQGAGVPDGHVLVPLDAISAAATELTFLDREDAAAELLNAMLAAAPKPADQQEAR